MTKKRLKQENDLPKEWVLTNKYYCLNKITPEFIGEDNEVITVTNGKICEYFYRIKNKNHIVGICIECDEGYLYIRSSSFRSLEIFLSKKKFTAQEFERCESYNK